MTEAQWNTCTDFPTMLRFLHHIRCTKRHRATDPRARLLACVCCRRIAHLLDDERSRLALDAVEGDGIGVLSAEALAATSEGAVIAWQNAVERWRNAYPADDSTRLRLMAHVWAASAVVNATGRETYPLGRRRRGPRGTVALALKAAIHAVVCAASGADGQRRRKEETAAQRALLHDLFGNPFRPASIAPDVREWNRGTCVRLAQAIDDDRGFTRLPILGDALEDAGCTEEAILAHCRQPGLHARGCWVVDLVMGRE